MSYSNDRIPLLEKEENFYAHWWAKLTHPQSNNEEDARQEYMTKAILVFNNLVILPFTLLAIPGYLLKLIPLDTLLILIFMGAFFILGWHLANKGRWRMGGTIPCLTLILAGLYGNYIGGMDTPALLLYALAIVLAVVVMGTRTNLGLLVLLCLGILGFGLAHTLGFLPQSNYPDSMLINQVGIVFATLTSIYLGVWFLKDQYQHSFSRARLSAEHTRAILETVTDGIVFTDLGGEILDLNDSMLRLYHFENRNQILGEHLMMFLVEEDRTKAAEFYEGLLKGNQVGLLNCNGTRLGGEEIIMEINAAVFLDAQKQPIGFVSTIRDVTERKKSELELTAHRDHLEELVNERTMELKEAYSELESFSYSVSHDLRSPLRRIEGFANILSEDYRGLLPPQGLAYLKRINEVTHRLLELINDLLAFSHLIRQPVKLSLIQPGEIAREVTDELMAGDYHIQNAEIYIQDMPACYADPILLRQVYFNLIENAFKYSQKQKKTCIEVGSKIDDQEKIIYYVADKGIGFDMQYSNHLFGVFQRLHAENEYEGTGIGLATVQRIIRRHNGSIWVESQIDEGATFYFTLGDVEK